MTRSDASRRAVLRSPPGEDGALFRFLSTSKDSVVASAATDVDVDLVHALLDEAEIVVWSAGTSVADDPRFAPRAPVRASGRASSSPR